MYIRKYKYNKRNITPQTRLSDLVVKKYHPQLRQMINELSKLAHFDGESEWWRVRKLIFNNPRTQRNYVSIATFIDKIAGKDCDGLKCSINTFCWYITSTEHSNLSAKNESVKTLIYSKIRYENEKKKQ